jgi:hypothetical protein
MFEEMLVQFQISALKTYIVWSIKNKGHVINVLEILLSHEIDFRQYLFSSK